MVSIEFWIGFVGTVVLGLLGFLLSRSLSQVDENIKGLREAKHDLANAVGAVSHKVALLEERLRRLTDDFQEFENGKGRTKS